MRFEWSHGPSFVLLLAACSGLALLSCTRNAPDEAALDASAPAATTPMTTLRGDWYEIQVPPKWLDLPLVSDRRRALVARELNSPKSDPDVLVIIARPIPATKDTPLEAVVTAFAGAAGGRAPVVEKRLLAGEPAVVATTSSQNAKGAPATFQTWGALVQNNVVIVQCGGTGPGAAESETLCPEIMGTFHVSGALTKPALPAVPPLSALAVRRLGGVSLLVPPDWQTAAADWVQPPVVGVAHSKLTATGPVQYAAVQVSELGDAGSADTLAAQLDVVPILHLVRREPFAFTVGKGVETEMRDAVSSTFFYYDVVAKGAAYEVNCTVPTEEADAFRPVCQAIAKSLRVQ